MAENVMKLIEEKIKAVPTESSEVTGEHVIAALEAIRAAINQNGAFVIPVEITAGGFPEIDPENIKPGDTITLDEDVHMKPRCIQLADDSLALVAFTSSEEMQKGTASHTITIEVGNFLDSAMMNTNVSGIIINPWDKSFYLPKSNIEAILRVNLMREPEDERRKQIKYDNDDQINALITAGADDVVFEYEYVNTTEKRPFQMLLDMAQPGDTILAVELCRVCSSAREFCHIAQAIRAKKLRLQLLDGFTINCREEPYCPETEAYMLMATALYELEESKRYRRMVPGSSGVRFESKRIGRPQTTKEDIPEVFFTYYPIYEAERITATEFARLCNVSRPTIYKYIRIVRESE